MGITTTSSIAEFSKRLMARAQDIKKRVESLRGKSVKVGIPASATYPNGKSVAEVAEQIEYGINDNGSPMMAGPRPFLRLAAAENKKKWNRMLVDGVRTALRRQMRPNLRPLMTHLGETMQHDIQKSMMSFPDPVFDTGRMHDSICILEINGERTAN